MLGGGDGCSHPGSAGRAVGWGGLGTHPAPLPWVLRGSPTLRGCLSSLRLGGSAPPKLLQAEGGGLKNTWWTLNPYPLGLRGAGQAPPPGGWGGKVTLKVGFGLKRRGRGREGPAWGLVGGASYPPHPPLPPRFPHPPPHPTSHILYPVPYLLPPPGVPEPPTLGPPQRVSPGWAS